jgi:alpha-1,3-rhamnosyltransferase
MKEPVTNSPFCDEYVTVVALCFNQSQYLKTTLNSILSQTWRPKHFYIIDDCSTDDSVAKINEWLDANGHPATLIRHEQNCGITRTMNHALSLCNTKYFHPWPCDDLLMPDKIKSQVDYLESLDWEPGFLYGDIQWIDQDGVVFRESVVADRRNLFPNGEMPSGNIFPQLVQHGCFIPTASGFYVTKALKELGGFDEKLFAEDWDMFMRISLKYGIAFKNQVFSQYRRHRESAEMKKGDRYWDGHFKILPRFLGTNKQYDDLIYAKLCSDAIEASKGGYFKAIHYILKNAVRRFDAKLLYIYFRMRLKTKHN